ncbi:hypothetical protein E2562_009292 [Oryza meyeriana var. granulata]|uniref:Uncharacterized protein n=1 Tax=Oryza meyeriana var. granulata TaxID=110450 RepID=A0A6G1EA56_9ORYZ|nr:hypothetical protein E2562_009292 [Oryza meyeriana var. granulata]
MWFNNRKKELIGEIGFAGILDIKLTKDMDQELPFGPKDVNEAYDELKACLQDGFQLVDCILPCISDFVHLTNNQTATEASTKYKRALKSTVVKPAKIVMKATVRNGKGKLKRLTLLG